MKYFIETSGEFWLIVQMCGKSRCFILSYFTELNSVYSNVLYSNKLHVLPILNKNNMCRLCHCRIVYQCSLLYTSYLINYIITFSY